MGGRSASAQLGLSRPSVDFQTCEDLGCRDRYELGRELFVRRVGSAEQGLISKRLLANPSGNIIEEEEYPAVVEHCECVPLSRYEVSKDLVEGLARLLPRRSLPQIATSVRSRR